MTPEEELARSLCTLRRLVESLTTRSTSASAELLRLDFLVRKYPAAAHMSLRFAQRTRVNLPAPPGWSPEADLSGVPLWRWHGGCPVYVATGDLDQLRFLGAALSRFDRMTAEELHAYLRE
jgi:hypothetical protein